MNLKPFIDCWPAFARKTSSRRGFREARQLRSTAIRPLARGVHGKHLKDPTCRRPKSYQRVGGRTFLQNDLQATLVRSPWGFGIYSTPGANGSTNCGFPDPPPPRRGPVGVFLPVKDFDQSPRRSSPAASTRSRARSRHREPWASSCTSSTVHRRALAADDLVARLRLQSSCTGKCQNLLAKQTLTAGLDCPRGRRPTHRWGQALLPARARPAVEHRLSLPQYSTGSAPSAGSLTGRCASGFLRPSPGPTVAKHVGSARHRTPSREPWDCTSNGLGRLACLAPVQQFPQVLQVATPVDSLPVQFVGRPRLRGDFPQSVPKARPGSAQAADDLPPPSPSPVLG